LRQQVATLKKERPRPVLDDVDRAFWVALRTSWPGWMSRLAIENPDTVAKWNRDRFRRYWAKPSRTAYRCPWQNPVAEWIGSCRRELLEHVVVFGERHLVRLIRSYLEYYHGDRSHLGLGKDAPNHRAVTQRPSATAKVVALPRVGGLHHRYEWRVAA